MKLRKRILSVVLGATLILSLGACGNKEKEVEAPKKEVVEQQVDGKDEKSKSTHSADDMIVLAG